MIFWIKLLSNFKLNLTTQQGSTLCIRKWNRILLFKIFILNQWLPVSKLNKPNKTTRLCACAEVTIHAVLLHSLHWPAVTVSNSLWTILNIYYIYKWIIRSCIWCILLKYLWVILFHISVNKFPIQKKKKNQKNYR